MSMWQYKSKNPVPDANGVNQSTEAMERNIAVQERVARTLDRLIGPNEKLIALQEQLKAAFNDTGNASQQSTARIRDLQIQLSNAQRTADRANSQFQGPGLAQNIARSLYTARVGNGNFMPLLGQGLDALTGGEGMAALSNPYVLAGAAVSEFAKQVYRSADEAAQAGRRFSDLSFQTGGTIGETARLSVLRDATGVDVGQLAEALNQRITTDPIARANAGRFGVAAMPGPYAQVDIAKNLLKAIDGLRMIHDEQERIRTARSMGLEGALPLTRISDPSYQALKNDAKLDERLFDPKMQQDSADFQVESKRSADGIARLTRILGKKVLPFLNPVLRGIGDKSRDAAEILEKTPLPEVGFDATQFFTNPIGFWSKIAAEMTLHGLQKKGKLPGATGVSGVTGVSDGGAGMDTSTGSNISATTGNTEALMIVASHLANLNRNFDRANNARPASLSPFDMPRFAEQGYLSRNVL